VSYPFSPRGAVVFSIGLKFLGTSFFLKKAWQAGGKTAIMGITIKDLLFPNNIAYKLCSRLYCRRWTCQGLSGNGLAFRVWKGDRTMAHVCVEDDVSVTAVCFVFKTDGFYIWLGNLLQRLSLLLQNWLWSTNNVHKSRPNTRFGGPNWMGTDKFRWSDTHLQSQNPFNPTQPFTPTQLFTLTHYHISQNTLMITPIYLLSFLVLIQSKKAGRWISPVCFFVFYMALAGYFTFLFLLFDS